MLAVHEGEGEVSAEISATLYSVDEICGALTATRFEVEMARVRGPLPHEHQGDRVYVFARATP